MKMPSLAECQQDYVPAPPATSPKHAARLLCNQDYLAWDAALARSPQNNVFFSTPFLNLFAQATGWRQVLIGCFERERLVGGVVGRLRSRNSTTVFDRLLLVPYNGCWIEDGPAQLSHRQNHYRQAILETLLHDLQSRHAGATIDLHPTNFDTRLFSWNGWTVAVRYTLINQLSAGAEPDCAPSVRRRARRAAAGGAVFDDQVPPDQFAQLWVASLRRQQIEPPISTTTLVELLTCVLNTLPSTIYGTRLRDGRLVAGATVLYDNHTAYYWLSGFDPDEPFQGASNQLCHMEMLRAVSRRVGTFDWIGANTRPIADYKESFGPTVIPYYRAIWHKQTTTEPNNRPSRLRDWLRECVVAATRHASPSPPQHSNGDKAIPTE